jgi:hypothetical protein
MIKLTKTLSALAIVGAVLGFGGVAFAAPKTTANTALEIKGAVKGKKEASRVSFEGTFAKWIISPRGEINGMILGNGALVRFPAHGFTVDASKLKAGDVVHVDANEKALPDGTIYGKPLIKKGMDVIVDATGKPTPWDKTAQKPKLQKMKTSGTVAGFLLDGKDRKIALVLDGGEIAWANTDLMELGVKKGDAVTIQGKGGSWSHGTAMALDSVTLPNGKVVAIPHVKHEGKGKQKKSQ